MARISTYPIISTPTVDDLLIGTDVNDLNITKNFTIGEIGQLIGQDYVPYVGATGNVNLGSFNITASSFIVPGGLASQFVKADGSLDSTAYTPQTRTLTINGTTYNLSANRSWDLNTINSLTTIGTGGAATYIGKVLNIPVYQAQGDYITQLSGEATAVGPGNATVTLSNSAVINKVLTGLNVTGGTVVSTDTILQAFGKVQNQINGLAGGVEYQGTWNAATNTPTLQSSVGVQGHYYVVNVAGNTNLNGITDWQVGDWAIYNGSAWEKVDNTDAVVSVNGYVGAVVLTSSDVGAVPTTRTITINGVGYNLSADRAWTVGDVRTDQSYINPSWISSLAWSKITGTPTTLSGYGITDGALNTRTLTINGITYDLTANRTWNVGTVTSVGTSGPLTGGTITGSGTIGITQAGASSDGYLSSADWNAFNSKQEVISVTAPITFAAGVIGITQSGVSTDGYLSSIDWNTFNNKVGGSGTANTIPMWGTASSLINSPLSYAADAFNFQYNSATGGTVNFTNIGLIPYTYSIQMNNFGSPRSTVHSYTDGVVIQSIGGIQVSRMFADGNLILGTSSVNTGHKLTISGDLYVNTIVNAISDTDRFIVSDGGVIKYRTGSEILSDIGAQGALTLTTIGTSGPATLISNTLNIPDYGSVLTGYVPYTGATQNVNLGEFGISAGYFQADLTPTQAAGVGRLIWNNADGTLNLRLLGGNVDLHLGQQQYARVVNGTGGNVLRSNYQVVKIIGAQGQRMQVGLAKADNDANSKDTIGLIAENINNNNEGFVVSSGLIEEINTTGSLQGETWADGDTLYLSGTIFGALTNIKPTAPIHTVIVGFVVYAHANHGKIFVKVDNGYELEELHDVSAEPFVNNGLLYRDTTLNLWKSATISTILGYTPAPQGNYITSLTGEATASGPGAASVTLSNSAVTGKVLTGLNIAGNEILSTDSILTAFGKLQHQVNQLVGGLQYEGTWNASTNTPTITSSVGTDGTFYIVSVAGTTNINGINDWQVGDWIVFHDTAWQKVDNSDSVSSVFGRVGNIVANQSDYSAFYPLIADIKNGVLTVQGTGVLSGSGTFSANQATNNTITLTHAAVSRTDTTSAQAPSFGGSFTAIDSVTSSAEGHITAINTKTVTVPSTVATATQTGLLSSTDWSIFNGKQNAITLTTTGTTGPSTFIGNTLNIPNYTPDLSGYVTLGTDQTITGLKTILRGGDVLNFKIGTDTLYGLKVAYNQNELVPSGEATWSFVNTFNRNGVGYETTPISFFRGVLVTGERLLSASINTNLLDYYSNNPSGRYPVYAYNTGVQQFSTGIIVGNTTGVVNAVTGAIADLPAGVVANFNGRVIGGNAVNSNEFVTLSQVSGYVPTSRTITINGTTQDLSANRTFNVGTVTSVTASSPLASSGGTTPNITISQSSGSTNGFLSSTDWNTFNNKANANGSNASGTWGISITGNAATVGTIAADRIVYGGSGSRQGVTQISDWNQTAFPNAAFLSSENSTPNAPTTDFTYGVQTSFHRGSPEYRTQFVTSLYGNNVYWLRQFRDSAAWSSWVQVIHSGNFNSYSPTLTGGGASGTWGINITGSAGSAGSVDFNNLTNKSGGTGTYQTSGDFRAPIFYDSNNTAYYLDPASTSNIGNLQTNTGPAMSGGWNRSLLLQATYPVVVFNSNGSKYSGIGVDFSSTTTGFVFWVNGSNADISGSGTAAMNIHTGNFVSAAGSFRAPIFYDSDNTGFYLDPNSTGISSNNAGGAVFRNIQISSASLTDTIQNVSSGGNIWLNYGHNGPIGLGYGGGLTTAYASLAVNGTSSATGNMRAPIFYDSNDTNYYVDPAAGTNLYSTFQVSGAHSDSQIGVRLLASNNGAGTGEVNLRMWCSEPGVTWAWAGFGYNVTNNNGSPGGFGRLNTNFGQAYMRFSTEGDLYFYNTNTGGTRTQSLYLGSSGAAVFGNTVQTGSVWINNGNNFNAYDENIRLFNAPNGVSVIAFSATGVSGMPTTSILGYSDRMEFRYGNGAQYRIYDGYTESMGSSRAPIFYDSNNTGYYVDPASSSYLVTVYANDWFRPQGNVGVYWPSHDTRIFSDSSGYLKTRSDNGIVIYNRNADIRGIVYFDGSGFGLLNNIGGWSVRANYGSGYGGELTGSWTSSGDHRAPIFYDSNNTAYYLNPNGGSYLAGSLEIANGYFLSNGIGGAMYMTAVSGSFGGYLRTSGHMVLDQINAGYNVYVLDGNSVGVVKNAGSQSWSAFSDATIKTVHSTIKDNLSKLQSITPIYYSFNNFEDDKNRIGLIAQEVQEHFPELVEVEPRTEKLTLDYTGLIPILLGAIKELKTEIETLKTKQ